MNFQGLTTLVLTATDVDAAIAWYASALGVEPYFRRPETGPASYAEFRIGVDEDELGIMDRAFAPGASGDGTSTTYWQVTDVEAAMEAFLARGAEVHTPVVDRGAGFLTASVRDPFGNVLGLMRSPHWAAKHE